MITPPRALLLAAALSGCVRSELDPAANVQVTGTLLAPGGAGAAGVEVVLSRSAGNLCEGTLEAFARSTTDVDGQYRFFLRGSDTQLNALARCFRVAPGPAPDGTQVTAELLLQVTRPALPPLLQGAFSLSPRQEDPGIVRLGFVDLRAEAGGGQLTLELADGAGQLAWQWEGPATTTELDGRLLEDFSPLGARLRLERRADGDKTEVALRWESPPVLLAPGHEVPLSRGASCSFGGEPGCPLTDGMLQPVGATADNLSVALALAAPAVPDELVVRGFKAWTRARTLELSGTTAAGVSTVLGNWSPEGGFGGFHRVKLGTGGEPVSILSLRWLDEAGQPVPVTGLSEVSVFGAP